MVKKVVVVLLAVMLAGCASMKFGEQKQSPETGWNSVPPRAPAPAAKPAPTPTPPAPVAPQVQACDAKALYTAWQQATGAAKVAAATAYMSCYKQLGGTEEMRCETKKRVVGKEEVIFMSTGCGNLTPKPEDTRKGGHRIASGYPFSDCPVDSPKAFIDSYEGPERCQPRVSMQDYGRLLEVMGLPVTPNAEGFKKFMLSGDVKVVECTAELLSKVNMSRTNATGTAFDFGHTRRECYKYGDKTEKLLVYQKQKTVDETVCIVPPPPAAPVAKPAPTPPPAVSATPGSCPATERTFRVHAWNESEVTVKACLAQSQARFNDPAAFSRNSCIVALVKGEQATGLLRPWHLPGNTNAQVSLITPQGVEVEKLREVVLTNGFFEFKEPYAKVAGNHLRVVFQSAPGEILSPVASSLGLREVRIAPAEFERPTCAYDISAAVRPAGGVGARPRTLRPRSLDAMFTE